jgi:hypothetical protein
MNVSIIKVKLFVRRLYKRKEMVLQYRILNALILRYSKENICSELAYAYLYIYIYIISLINIKK